MAEDFHIFGSPDRFAISVRWRGDQEPLARRPLGYGWSIGDLKIEIGGRVLTRHKRGAASQAFVSWYLLPIIQWIARNWVELLHEEDFAWPETSAQSGAVAGSRALTRWMSADDEQSQAFYKQAQAWHGRHALRSAASGGLLPDLFCRRYLDTIELSWTNVGPAYAGEGFAFIEDPGIALLPVEDVAKPLWDFLAWVTETAVVELPNDIAALDALKEQIAKLDRSPNEVFEAAYASPRVLSIARERLKRAPSLALRDVMVPQAPAVQRWSPAVAMFGGVDANLEASDVQELSALLEKACEGKDSDALAALVEDGGPPPSRAPYVPGYQFASELLDELEIDFAGGWIDVRALVHKLGIDVVEVKLATESIRGVALAGDDMRPTILVNLASPYNAAEEGRRFSIAHELCHVLYDRSFARRVAVSSGPWAPPGVEKRANAFAAMLLMPSALVARLLPRTMTAEELNVAARSMRVSAHALIEHLYNIHRIDEVTRDHLRAARFS